MFPPTAFKKMTKSLIRLPWPCRFPSSFPCVLYPRFPEALSDLLLPSVSVWASRLPLLYVLTAPRVPPFIAVSTVTILFWCWDFFKLVSGILLSHRFHMDKGPCLLLLRVVSPMLIPCLILSSYSIKMNWMNKFYVMLMTCHFIAKSYIIIEVEANAIKNAHSLLCSLNPWPTHWHPPPYPAVIPDHPEDFGGQERNEGKGWRMWGCSDCTPAPKVSTCYMTAVGSIWNPLYQLFKTHNSIHIKDLLQQTEKQNTDTKKTGNRGSAIKVTQYI